MCDGLDGSVRPMRDGKGVVDIDIAEARQLRGKLAVVLFFAFVEARIFEAKNIAGLHRGDGLFGDLADAICGK